jgi:predicted RNA-binding Zn-ribbon protein involved in translation (DUF1610 family)
MPITFECTRCGKKLRAPDDAVGKTSRCPGCGAKVTCPAPGEDAGIVEMIVDGPERVDPHGDLDAAAPYGLVEPEPAAPSAFEGRRPCPMCGEMILATAAKCRYCGEVFDPALRRTVGRTTKKYSAADESLGSWEIVAAVLCNGIACIIGIIWMIQGKPKGLKMFGLALGVGVIWYIIGVILGLVLQTMQGARGIGGP